ncbi:MAG TPA: polyprenyl synthetase family protein [Anaerolineaceae bacterium]|nr:polyprenyl synthetase family protein [Anaerolineaceae bacterium]
MNFHHFSQEMIPDLEEELLYTIEHDIPDSFPGLKEMMKYHFGWTENDSKQTSQGKRIRPIILMLSTLVCGGEWRKALPAAVAIELIHNFSLIHDDIEDHSEMRRGQKTLWKVFGVAQAINTGDAMFSLAQLNILKVGNKINKSVGFDTAQKLNETCLVLTGGQNLDISFENQVNVSEDEYFKMIGGKTAALLAASAEIGAIVAQSSNTNKLALRSFGEALGLAFQAWDDWLGIWGDEGQTGKSTLSDLIAKKKSLPILYAIQNSTEFESVFSKDSFDQKDLVFLIEAMEKVGAKEHTEKIANYYSELAINSLKSISTPHSDPKNALLELTRLLINRQH